MLVGAAIFILATLYLAIERCSSGCTGFLEGMNRTPSLSTSSAIVIGIVSGRQCYPCLWNDV